MRAVLVSLLFCTLTWSTSAFLPPSVFQTKPLTLRPTTWCPHMVASPPSNDPLEPLKKLWINLERAAVTITQGTEMAEAAVTLEENSPLEPLKKLWINLERAAVTITQGTEMAEAAVTLEEDRLFGSRRLAKAHKAFHDASTTLLRSAGHISGVWLHHHEDYFSRGTELSGGFNEGAGDDLPLIRVEQAKDSRYGESAVRKGYSADAFKD